MKKLKVKVQGITCSGCAVDVASALKNKDGIMDAAADYATGNVDVDYDPRELNEQQVLDLIQRLGLKKL